MKNNTISVGKFGLSLTIAIFALSAPVLAVNYDLTMDGSVDWPDVSAFSQQWLGENCVGSAWCAGADFSRNGRVGFEDFALLAQHWRSVYQYITTLLAGHEVGERHIEIRGPRTADPSLTIAANLFGGTLGEVIFGDVPTATEGEYLVGLTWAMKPTERSSTAIDSPSPLRST